MYYFALIIVGNVIMQFLLLPFYVRLKHNNRYKPLKIVIKGSITLIPVIYTLFTDIVLYRRSGSLFSLTTDSGFSTNIFLLAGLFICMIADMVLVCNFLAGMLLFLSGHLCYITYFIYIGGFSPFSIIVFLAAGAVVNYFFKKFRDNIGSMLIPYFAYGTVILTTLSLGVMLPFSIGSYGIVPAIAAVLLVASDLMLAANKVNRRKVLSDLLYLGYYFMGQFFLSMSVFVPVFFNL